jgi:long-chain acyl-CoA synthetase
VIGIHDPVHGENVRAYITLQEGAERPRRQELIQFARARVGYKAPEEIVVLDEMPRTADGKVDRTAVKQTAEATLTVSTPKAPSAIVRHGVSRMARADARSRLARW